MKFDSATIIIAAMASFIEKPDDALITNLSIAEENQDIHKLRVSLKGIGG